MFVTDDWIVYKSFAAATKIRDKGLMSTLVVAVIPEKPRKHFFCTK